MKTEFHGLDSTRTLLALSVALGHYFYWNSVPTFFPQSFFLAVGFFFILSGFVLTQSIMFDKSANLNDFVSRFAIRRCFRLMPLYLFLFPLSAAITCIKFWNDPDPFYYYLISLGLLQSIGFDAGAKHVFSDTTIGIAWSISVEFWVGLAYFPAVFALRSRPALLVLFATALSIFGFLLLINFSPIQLNVNLQRTGGIFTFGSIRGVLGFSLGTICFLGYRSLKQLELNTFSPVVLEIAVFVLLAVLFVRNGYNHQNDFVGPVLFAVLILLLSLEAGWISKALASRWLTPLRSLSYSIYLIHPFFVFLWLKFEIPFDHKRSMLYAALILITSALLHRLIEQPWIAKGRIFLLQEKFQIGSPADSC